MIGRALLAGVMAVGFVGCGLVPRDDRPPVVKAAADAAPTTPSLGLTDTERAAYIAKIAIKDVHSKWMSVDLLNERRAYVEGEVKNTGTKTVSRLQLTVYFLDDTAKRVHEDTYFAVLANNPFQHETPLKSNYARPFSAGFRGVPAEWSGKVEVKVTDIEIVSGEASIQ